MSAVTIETCYGNGLGFYNLSDNFTEKHAFPVIKICEVIM